MLEKMMVCNISFESENPFALKVQRQKSDRGLFRKEVLGQSDAILRTRHKLSFRSLARNTANFGENFNKLFCALLFPFFHRLLILKLNAHFCAGYFKRKYDS